MGVALLAHAVPLCSRAKESTTMESCREAASGVAKVGPGGAQALPTRPGAPQTSTMKSDGAVKSHKQERLQIGNACSVFL